MAIWERDIGETVATCRFTDQLLMHNDIRGVSGCLTFSQGWRRWARFLRRQRPQQLQPTEQKNHRSAWSWVSLRGLGPWGRRRRLWLWCMLTHLLALLRWLRWLIVYHCINIASQCIYHLSLANCLRFFAIIVILNLILILILYLLFLLIFLLLIILLLIITDPFHIHISI